jgi:hypothetical protein
MSPVSRGRKAKAKNKGRGSGRPGAARQGAAGVPAAEQARVAATLARLTGPASRPAWFDSSIESVLDGADVLLGARGPRQVEEATARLLGAQLHRALNRGNELRLYWWFEEVVAAAAMRVGDGLAGTDGAWQAPWRLLHGLTSIGTPELASVAGDALAALRPDVRRVSRAAAAPPQPPWLGRMAQITATGEVWQMRDVYGGRIGVVAGFSYPQQTDPSVFLFDIDACGFVALVGAGVFDDVAQAATAWRALVGVAAHDATPHMVRQAEELQSLVYWETGEMHLMGTETRVVMDNWFRAQRRADDLEDALRKRGMPLPQARSLYHDIDIDPAVEAFTGWHIARYGVEPDPEAVGALAEEWLEGALPGTEHMASPHRVEFQLRLISDWQQDPVTLASKALLPEWVRWNGEQAGLPEPLINASVAVASGGSRAASDCPAAH